VKIDKQSIMAALRPDMSRLLMELKPDAKPSGKGKLLARCLNPDSHNNGDASPSMLLFEDNGGFKCQACGERGTLFDLYSKVHGVDFKSALNALAEKAGIDTGNKIRQRVAGRYEYLDQNGLLAYFKERLEPSRDGKRPKEFIFKNPAGKPGQSGIPLLYRLPEILRAEQGTLVIFTEGEKHADLLAGWGLVATSLPHGSGSTWHESYTAPMVGKHMAILADNDVPGRMYAENICKALHDKVASIKVIDLLGIPEKGDVLDWVDIHGNDRSRLLHIIDTTPLWNQSSIEAPARMPAPDIKPNVLALRTGRELRAMDIKIEWLVEGVIPRNAVILLYGRGGIGKTTLAMQLADAIDQGNKIFGMQTVQTQVIVVDYENSLAVLSERAKRTTVDGVLFCDSSLDPPSLDKADWAAYLELLEQYPGALFIFDTLRSAHSGDENSSETMSLIMRRMRQLRDAGATVILLHHTPKGNDRQFKGSGAIFDLCDQTLALYQTAKPDSDQEASDDDDDPDKTYRFGTGKKTRYKPHRVFLSFDADQELFVMAKDPDDNALVRLHSIISQICISTCAKQGNIVKAVESDGGSNFGGEKKIISLLKKGEGKYWTIEKGLHNANIFYPIQLGSLADPIEVGELPNRIEVDNQFGNTSEKHTNKNDPQRCAVIEFGSLAKSAGRTGKQTVVEDAEFSEIKTYTEDDFSMEALP
jgi:archaellum biogenesis ATPase FlaH